MSRRKKKIVKRKVKITLFLLLIVIITSIFGYKHFFKQENSNNVNTPIINNITKKEEPKDEVYNLSLIATGDGLIHNLVAAYAKQSNGSYDFKPYLSEIKDVVSKYDVAYYNQETPFGTDASNYSYYPTFSVPSEYGDAMLDSGFNLISLASNHSYDKGEAGVLRSFNYWQKQKDIIFNGIADSKETRNNYQIGEKNNITYAMLSYTYGLNGFKLPGGKDYLVNVFDYDTALKDIEYLRDKVDVLIVAMHWGVEYSFEPTETQKEQAKWLAEHDVDIVIGNHSHCLEPIEWIDNTLIIYSLGNFISNQGILKGGNYTYQGTVKGSIGAFATLNITKTITPKKEITIDINDLKVDLLYTYRNSKEKYYKILPFSKMNDEYMNKYYNSKDDYWYIGDYQKIYEMYSSIIKKYDNTINILPLANS